MSGTADVRVRRAAVALLLVVAAGSLVLSFAGLALLGELAGFGDLAPVFAVVVDAGTGAGTLYWLAGVPSSPRTRYARRLGLTLLTVSLVGNAAAHGLAAGGAEVSGLAAGLVLTMPWWAAALVGAIPPATFAGVVHLLAMRDELPPPAGDQVGDQVGEGWETDADGPPDWWASAPASAPSTVAEYVAARAVPAPRPPASPTLPGDLATAGDEVGEHRDSAGHGRVTSGARVGEGPSAELLDDAPAPGALPVAPTSSPAGEARAGERANPDEQVGDVDEGRLAELVAEGAGRRKVARELDVTEHVARQLLARAGRESGGG